MRKLATVQEVDQLLPIPNADRIETATIKGKAWKVIVGKGEFQSGDKAIYFETDTLLPETNPIYESFQKRGQKTVTHEGETVKGHVLRTMKMRGVYSQGLLLPLDKFDLGEVEVGTDVSDLAGVIKYEEPLPVGNQEIIGSFDTRLAPKTDSERLQNLGEYWEEIKELDWEASVKVDGTSQTVANDNGKIRVFGRNWELDPETAPVLELLEENGILEILKENQGMAVQLELAGPKISGNRLKLGKAKTFIFSVWLDREKLPRDKWEQTLLDNAAPNLSEEWRLEGELEEMIEKVEGLRERIAKQQVDEGIVYHLVTKEAPEWLDGTRTIKIINNKYLTKHGL